MSEEHEIHLVTGTGLLCGARLTEPWTVTEDRVTCEACRELLRARHREQRESARHAVLALTEIFRKT